MEPITLAVGGVGMLLRIIRDAARAKDQEPAFSWHAWIGERPWQFLARGLVVLAYGTPKIATYAGQVIATSGIPLTADLPFQVPAAFFVGLYGDKIVKSVLERAESIFGGLPGVGRIINVGKKIS